MTDVRVCPRCEVKMHRSYDHDFECYVYDCPVCFHTTWDGDPDWTDE